MKSGKYVVTSVAGIFPEVIFCQTMKQARKKVEGLAPCEYRIFRADNDRIAQVAKNGHQE